MVKTDCYICDNESVSKDLKSNEQSIFSDETSCILRLIVLNTSTG